MKLTKIRRVIAGMFVFILIMNLFFLNGQTNGIKQDVVLKKAEIAYQYYKYSIAADYYETYIKNPSNLDKEVLQKLADCYWQMRKYDQALRVYNFLYPNRIQGSSQKEQLRIAELYARTGQYQLASKWLKGVDGYDLKAQSYKENTTMNAMKKDSVNWKLGFLNINTSFREYSPFIINNILFYSSNKPEGIKTKAFGWDSSNFACLWEIPLFEIVDLPLNQKNDSTLKRKPAMDKKQTLAGIYECGDIHPFKQENGLYRNIPYIKADSTTFGAKVKGLDKILFNAGTISMDYYHHFFFSANYPRPDKNGFNRICIMEGYYSTDGVTMIHILPFGDPNSYSVMHPAVNGDGTLLICSSDKATGAGGYDLYYSRRSDLNQPWDSLKAFGKNINTIGNEVFPSLTPNGFLYYSSDQLPGLGGLDIYRIPIKDALEGKGIPEHLSYPINSPADDFGWTQSDSTGMKAYFTSDRLNNNDNLYSATFIPPIVYRHPRKSYLEGFVLEKQSKRPVRKATVFLCIVREDSVYVAKTDSKGKYRMPVLNSSNLIIKVVDKRYNKLNCISGRITYVSQPRDTIQMAPHVLYLNKFKVGYSWKLSNIQYEKNKWNIPANALPILDSLVTLMKEQPLIIELGSHTDPEGTYRHNLILSQHRAETIAAYLVSLGIDPNRITAKGYGKSQLMTEVKITGFTVKQIEPDNIDPDLFNEGDIIAKNIFPKGFFNDQK